MTTISADVVAHSVNEFGKSIITVLCRYPRFIHAELMTHRAFSRNASSSRAIPVERLIADVERDPAVPMFWGKNQPGMQAREEHDAPVPHGVEGPPDYSREMAWLNAKDDAVRHAKAFATAGYHKQVVNRLLEPFAHINVVVTATEWENFFALRCHPDAEPHINKLAHEIQAAIAESEPEYLAFGDWHLPFIDRNDRGVMGTTELIKASVARCARTSYLTHELKRPNMFNDIILANKLLGSLPMHASPAEHQATPDANDLMDGGWMYPQEHGNFRGGWRQYRKSLPGECQ